MRGEIHSNTVTTDFTTSFNNDATPTEDQERSKRGQHYTLEEAKGNRTEHLLSSRISMSSSKKHGKFPGDKMSLNK